MTTLLASIAFDDLAGRWLAMLLDATIKGTVILVLAGVTLRAMRRAPAAARQLVLLLALVSLLIMPIVSAALPGWQVLPHWAKFEAAAAAPATLAAPAVPATPAAPAETAKAPPPVRPAGDTPEHDSPSLADLSPAMGHHGEQDTLPASAASSVPPGQPSEQIATAEPAAQPVPASPAPARPARFVGWTMLAWAVGAFIFLLPLIVGRIAVWRLRRKCEPIVAGPAFDLTAKVKAHLGLKRPVLLLQSRHRTMPMMWGILRPVLLLPAEAADWSADRLWVVLLHELGHVKRHDMLTKLLANLACVVYWFNPLVWLAFRRFQTEAERACDDLVLSAGSDPSDYAQHILEVASGLEARMFAVHGSIALARPSKLEGRLLAILDPRRNRRRLSLLLILLAALLGTAVLVPLSILRARDAAADKPPPAEAKTDSDSPTTQPEKADLRPLLQWQADGTFQVNFSVQDVKAVSLRRYRRAEPTVVAREHWAALVRGLKGARRWPSDRASAGSQNTHLRFELADGRELYVKGDEDEMWLGGRSVADAATLGVFESDALSRAVEALPKDKPLPGSQLSVRDVVAQGFTFAAVCEAINDPVIVFIEGAHVNGASQKFRLLTLLGGARPESEVLTVDYFFISDPNEGVEHSVKKGERVLWIVRRRLSEVSERDVASWIGVKALADTPENRRAIIEAVKAAPPTTQPEDSPAARAKQIAVLIARLAAETFDEREKAQRDLVEIGLLALPALREAAKGNGGERGLRAQTAIDEIWARLKEQVRRAQEGEGKPEVRRAVRQWLQDGLPVLILAVKERWEQERPAVDALEQLGPAAKDAVPVLIKALEYKPPGRGGPALDDEWPFPACAQDALEAIGAPAVPALTTVLRDRTTTVGLRMRVVSVLSGIGPSVPGVVPALAEAAEDKNNLVRSVALSRLGIGEAARPALPAILKAETDSYPENRQLATVALEKLGITWSKPVDGLRMRVWLEGGRFEPDKPSVFNIEFENVSDKPLRILKDPNRRRDLGRVLIDASGSFIPEPIITISWVDPIAISPELTVLLTPGAKHRVTYREQLSDPKIATVRFTYTPVGNNNPELKDYWHGILRTECALVDPGSSATQPEAVDLGIGKVKLEANPVDNLAGGLFVVGPLNIPIAKAPDAHGLYQWRVEKKIGDGYEELVGRASIQLHGVGHPDGDALEVIEFSRRGNRISVRLKFIHQVAGDKMVGSCIYYLRAPLPDLPPGQYDLTVSFEDYYRIGNPAGHPAQGPASIAPLTCKFTVPAPPATQPEGADSSGVFLLGKTRRNREVEIARLNRLGSRARTDDAIRGLVEVIERDSWLPNRQMACEALARVAPDDPRTRAALRGALARGSVGQIQLRRLLVEIGDSPAEHVNALIKFLESKDKETRIEAIRALGACGSHAAPALPALGRIKAAAKDALPSDYLRTYRSTLEMPEHVHAHSAIGVIEQAVQNTPPATQPDQADLPLPTGYMPLGELARTSQGILVARLQSIGRFDPGPPGATTYASEWTVVKVFRGDYAGDLRMAFNVQTIGKDRERMPAVGQTYILLTYPKPTNPTQIAYIIEETGVKLAEILKLAGLPATPATQPAATGFVSAKVVRWQLVGGQDIDQTIVVKETEKIDRLAGFFPGLGRNRPPLPPAGWDGRVIVTFARRDGTTLQIASDYEHWSAVGKGDWPVRGNLGAFIEELFKPSAPPATQPEALDLDAVAKLLAEKVGGTWKASGRTLLMGTVPAAGANGSRSFAILAGPMDEPGQKQVVEFARAVSADLYLLGANDKCTVLAWSTADSAEAKAVAKVLDLRPPTMTLKAVARAVAARLAASLRANKAEFRLSIGYRAPEAVMNAAEHGDYVLTLTVPQGGAASGPSRVVRITEDEAQRIIDYLDAEQSFLERAKDVMGKSYMSVVRPGCVWQVWGASEPYEQQAEKIHPMLLYDSTPAGPEMLARLDGLRKVLDGDAAKAMDEVLKRLEPHRKVWQKAAAPATQPEANPVTKPIAQLIQELADPILYDTAKTELGARGKSAVPALIAAVKDPDFKARNVAVICLGMIRDPETVPFLIECLGDKDWQVQERAAYALSSIGGQQAKDAIVAFLDRCLKDNSPGLTKAAEAIKVLPDPRALPTLLRIVQEAADGKRKGYEVRYAAEALGKIGDRRASPVLVRLLRPQAPYTDSWDYTYLEAIKHCKGRDALPGLVAYLDALVNKMKNDPEPTPQDGVSGKGSFGHVQEGQNAGVYWLAIGCLEAITSTKSEGATREQALKFWKEQAARAATQPDLPPATQPAAAVGWSEPAKGLRWRAWLSSGKVEAGGTVQVNIEFQNVSDQPFRLFKDVTEEKSVYPTVFTADGNKDVLPIEHPHESNIREDATVLVTPKGTYRAKWQWRAPQVLGATKLWFYYDAPINTNPQVKGFWTGLLPGLTLEFTIIAPGQAPPATQPADKPADGQATKWSEPDKEHGLQTRLVLLNPRSAAEQSLPVRIEVRRWDGKFWGVGTWGEGCEGVLTVAGSDGRKREGKIRLPFRHIIRAGQIVTLAVADLRLAPFDIEKADKYTVTLTCKPADPASVDLPSPPNLTFELQPNSGRDTFPNAKPVTPSATQPAARTEAEVGFFLGQLKQANPGNQEFIVQSLARLGAPAVSFLIEAVKSQGTARGDANLRTGAAAALGQIGPAARDAVPALIEMLRANRAPETFYAYAALGGIGPAAAPAVPLLVETIRTSDDGERVLAIRAIWGIGPAAKAAVPALIAAAGDKSEMVRLDAVVALGRIGPDAKEAVPVLVKALKDTNIQIPFDASRSLAEIGEEAVPAVVDAMKGPDPAIRDRAMRTLGRMGGRARVGVPALIEVLKNPLAPNDRDLALRVLGDIGPAAKTAIPVIEELVRTGKIVRGHPTWGFADPDVVLREIRGDEGPPATQPEAVLKTLSPLAQKLAASLPRGWKLTDCGRCDAPIGWSGKTDCEFLTFAHETLKAEVMGLVGPASFTAWLTPGNYAGRLLPQQTTQPREAGLTHTRSDRLLFMDGPGVVDNQAWAAVEKVLTDVLGFARNPNRASEGTEPPPAPPTERVKPVSEAEALSGAAAPPPTQPD